MKIPLRPCSQLTTNYECWSMNVDSWLITNFSQSGKLLLALARSYSWFRVLWDSCPYFSVSWLWKSCSRHHWLTYHSMSHWSVLYSLGTYFRGNTVLNSSVVTCGFVTTGTCFAKYCLTVAVCSGFSVRLSGIMSQYWFMNINFVDPQQPVLTLKDFGVFRLIFIIVLIVYFHHVLSFWV
jgi:hypothetical protein